jgi:hypothetical protein
LALWRFDRGSNLGNNALLSQGVTHIYVFVCRKSASEKEEKKKIEERKEERKVLHRSEREREIKQFSLFEQTLFQKKQYPKISKQNHDQDRSYIYIYI